MSHLGTVDREGSGWGIFNPLSPEFKEAEETFHKELSCDWWRQALVVVASIVGGLFFVVGAFPVFCWTVRALKPGENQSADTITEATRNHFARVKPGEVQPVEGGDGEGVVVDREEGNPAPLPRDPVPRGPVPGDPVPRNPAPGAAIPAPAPLPNLTLPQQIDLAKREDRKAGSNGWKRGLGASEREQSLIAFMANPDTIANAHRNLLIVCLIGRVSEEERKMLQIVTDYLQVIHGLDTGIPEEIFDLNPADSRHRFGKQQYALEAQMETLLGAYNHDGGEDGGMFSIGFTNQDVYPRSANGMNFCFGAGSPKHASGVFSMNRLSSNFNKTLMRLMTLASHEIGHMRGMDHCTENFCNMQGTNSLDELDREPLRFCAQDMAKICHLNGWSLKEGYTRQLGFFENFHETYEFSVDFSSEITHLKKKIAALS